MVAHRKNVPPPQAYVPSSWFIVLTVMVVIGGAGWLGWLFIDHDSSPDDTASPVATAPADIAEPTAEPSADPEPTADPAPTAESSEEPTPEPEETPDPEPSAEEPAASRDAVVSVLNNSGITGAARTFASKVTTAGWRLGGVGNWRGSIAANTVYYPPGLQPQAELLAADVGIGRVLPRVAQMRSDRLTIILSGPQ